MLEPGVPPFWDTALPQKEDSGEGGMDSSLYTTGPQGSTPFSSGTVSLTQDGWRNRVLLDWKIVSQSPPQQAISEESFPNPSIEMAPGESEHRKGELGCSHAFGTESST
ncbi:zinc finger protein 79-like isoform X6 [Cynocephalus volans]|uniref:zinc finger protein 79-like isoform X6 n=1 Tax=Cynocephalus volans TaxID=110931 RepID=UPI002FC6E8DC